MSYFEEIMENVPDTEVELYSLLETIKLSLAGMAKHIDDESEMYGFSEEFARVHDWYSLDMLVTCQRADTEGNECGAPTDTNVQQQKKLPVKSMLEFKI